MVEGWNIGIMGFEVSDLFGLLVKLFCGSSFKIDNIC